MQPGSHTGAQRCLLFPNTPLHTPVSLRGGKGPLLPLSGTNFDSMVITGIQKDLPYLDPTEIRGEQQKLASFREQGGLEAQVYPHSFTRCRDWASASCLEKVAATSPGLLTAWEGSLVFWANICSSPGMAVLVWGGGDTPQALGHRCSETSCPPPLPGRPQGAHRELPATDTHTVPRVPAKAGQTPADQNVGVKSQDNHATHSHHGRNPVQGARLQGSACSGKMSHRKTHQEGT